ncbi:hypothetical protein BaRGS_00016104 [Batillaria attramentaria]|uniref:HEPN domain-containing protein n=1 Tax=Batillaria attramentaria TaxID=370345 RepID=A0ABD0L0H6_9CAEN
MRVVKRLLLKWHPDKNKGNEEFCKRVFQTIQHYVDLLKQGVKELPEDEDEVDGVYNSQKGYNSFFEHMFRRGQAYSEHYGSGSGGPHSGGSWGFGSGGGNPQPTEGRRWFRQAEADLFAALDALQNCNGGLNWICFKCQQASEKALKAILYQRDAENYLLRAHDLRPLARLINDQELEHLARDLEDRLDNPSGMHTGLTYRRGLDRDRKHPLNRESSE